MNNIDIREAARSRGIYLWQIADALGIIEMSFSRRMRRELPPEDKAKVLQIIRNLSERGVE